MSAPSRQRYTAPALEKGLDVLELLAFRSEAVSAAEIAGFLARSRSEIFRMLSVLEDREYIERKDGESGYRLTTRLFELAMQQPPSGHLIGVALPVMERLAGETNQSCHLAVVSGDDMVVIARVESPDEVGFSVRIGHRRSVATSTSGKVILAHQSDERREAWIRRVRAGRGVGRAERMRELARIAKRGFERSRSSFVRGITDLSFPVFDGVASGAVAALTIPFVQRIQARKPIDEVAGQLRLAAGEISGLLEAFSGVGSSRRGSGSAEDE